MASSSSPVMTYEDLQRSKFLLGPWLVGTLLDILLLGALCSQFIRYFTWFSNDRVGTRLVVSGLVFMTFLKSIHTIAIAWIMFILHFKDLDGAINLNFTAWWQLGNPITIATIGLYVQIFFCYRLWYISKKNVWFVLPVGLVLFVAYGSVCVATYHIYRQSPLIWPWLAAHFSSVFAGDLMLTVFTAYLLLKSRNDVLPQTVGILSALVRLTFQTAAPVALCAMLELIFSQLYSGRKLISLSFNMVLPKLYAFSMMWTLNARRSLRANSGMSSELGHSAGSSGRRRGDVVLSTYSRRIEVRTHTDVTQHIDFNESGETNDSPEEYKRRG